MLLQVSRLEGSPNTFALGGASARGRRGACGVCTLCAPLAPQAYATTQCGQREVSYGSLCSLYRELHLVDWIRLGMRVLGTTEARCRE